MEIKDRLFEIKRLVSNPVEFENEIKPIFEIMDSDGSGELELKEYYITRYLFDGMCNRNTMSKNFMQLINSNENKLN